MKSKRGELEFDDTIKNNYLTSLKTLSGCRIKLKDLIYKTEILDLEILLILVYFLERAPAQN